MNAMTSIRGPCATRVVCALVRRHGYVRGEVVAVWPARTALARTWRGPEPPVFNRRAARCRAGPAETRARACMRPRVRVRAWPVVWPPVWRVRQGRRAACRGAVSMHQRVQASARQQRR